jgi:hypothetical protein
MSVKTIRDIDLLKTWLLQDSLNFTRYFHKKRFKRKYIVNSHHRQIADLLNKILSGEVKKAIINIAPRYGKTEQVVKSFISQGFALNPKSRFIHLSYSDDLVLDNSKEIQNFLLLSEYQRLFDAKPTSTNSKKWYTKEGGGLYAVSSSGQVTGFGAGLVDLEEENNIDEFTSCIDSEEFGGAIIYDDPIKPDDALSETIRNKINNKFESTIRSRVNSRKTPIIIIGHRVHEDDLCGYLMKKEPGEWTILSIPTIQTDENGEHALWKFKHTLEELRALQKTDAYVFATQYMQESFPKGGGRIKRDWFMFLDQAPNNIAYDLWIDGAYTINPKNCPTGFFVTGFDIKYNRLIIKYAAIEWLEIPDVIKFIDTIMKEQSDAAGMILIEPKASGYSMIQMVQKETLHNVTRITGRLVQDGKPARLSYAAPKVQSSRVWLVKANWNEEVILQLTGFPGYSRNEYVDLLGYAVKHYFG